jgi:catechol 2,3-dioxygenase-like lactoylglutathione lyase family enzyme
MRAFIMTRPQFGFCLEYVSDIEAAKHSYVDVLDLQMERYHPAFIQFNHFAVANDESLTGTRELELYWLVNDDEAAFRRTLSDVPGSGVDGNEGAYTYALLEQVIRVRAATTMAVVLACQWPVFRCPRMAGFGCPPRAKRGRRIRKLDPDRLRCRFKADGSIEPRAFFDEGASVVLGSAKGLEQSIGLGHIAGLEAFGEPSNQFGNALPGVSAIRLAAPSPDSRRVRSVTKGIRGSDVRRSEEQPEHHWPSEPVHGPLATPATLHPD